MRPVEIGGCRLLQVYAGSGACVRGKNKYGCFPKVMCLLGGLASGLLGVWMG